MTLALLILINMMWIPAGMFLLGKGEAKSTGFLTGVVGVLTVVGATIQTIAGKGDPFMGGFLFTFGCLFLTLAYCLVEELTDFTTLGNAALVVAIASAIYCFLFITGGAVVNGAHLIGQSNYFAFCAATWVILTLSIFGFTRGKVSGKIVGWELIVLAFATLFVPAIGLMAYGTMPF